MKHVVLLGFYFRSKIPKAEAEKSKIERLILKNQRLKYIPEEDVREWEERYLR